MCVSVVWKGEFVRVSLWECVCACVCVCEGVCVRVCVCEPSGWNIPIQYFILTPDNLMELGLKLLPSPSIVNVWIIHLNPQLNEHGEGGKVTASKL